MRLPLLFHFLCITLPVIAQVPGVPGRQADVEQLSREIKTIHPNPFLNLTEDAWDEAVADLLSHVGDLSQAEFGVALQKLVALLGDAHSSVNPQIDPVLSTRRYPFELYLFEDGLYVRSAAPEYASLVGGRILRLGNADPAAAVGSVAETISHENTWWIRAIATERLVIPEVLEGLGMTDDPEHLAVSVSNDGTRLDTIVTPVPVDRLERHGHGTALDQTDWIDMRGSAAPPLWQRQPHDLMWQTWLEDSRTLYVCYRAVTSAEDGPSNAEFWDAVFAEADRRTPERFVIDIRENGGGNGMLNRPVIQQILRRPNLDQTDRLFVIIGRKTFSAAQQLANQLGWWTQATFVGEPTGQKVSQYGDAAHVVLNNSGISAFISTRFHQGPNPLDRRDFIPPEIYAPLTSVTYRSGVDPAMNAILSNDERPPVMSRVVGALQAGQFDTVERLLVNANMNPANRYRDFESQVNAIGYDLLDRGQVESAITVFQINTHVYPASANTFDSLGEALVQAGRFEEAISAYRKALEIDPTFTSSQRALTHLEGDPGH